MLQKSELDSNKPSGTIVAPRKVEAPPKKIKVHSGNTARHCLDGLTISYPPNITPPISCLIVSHMPQLVLEYERPIRRIRQTRIITQGLEKQKKH